MEEIGCNRVSLNRHLVISARCALMATLLFAAYIVMSPQQTLAENGESFGSSSVDYSKPCNKLLSAAPRLPSKRESLADEISSDLNRELQDLKNLQTSPPVKYSERRER